MSKIITYTKINESAYLENTDEIEHYGDEFKYEVKDSDLLNAIAKLANERYFNGKANFREIKDFLSDLDMLDELFDMFEEELKDYFEDRAYNEYEG